MLIRSAPSGCLGGATYRYIGSRVLEPVTAPQRGPQSNILSVCLSVNQPESTLPLSKGGIAKTNAEAGLAPLFVDSKGGKFFPHEQSNGLTQATLVEAGYRG